MTADTLLWSNGTSFAPLSCCLRCPRARHLCYCFRRARSVPCALTRRPSIGARHTFSCPGAVVSPRQSVPVMFKTHGVGPGLDKLLLSLGPPKRASRRVLSLPKILSVLRLVNCFFSRTCSSSAASWRSLMVSRHLSASFAGIDRPICENSWSHLSLSWLLFASATAPLLTGPSCFKATSRVQCCALMELRGRPRSTQSTVHRTPSNLEVRSSRPRRCFELPSGRSVCSPCFETRILTPFVSLPWPFVTFSSWTSCSSRCTRKNRQIHTTNASRGKSLLDHKCSSWQPQTPPTRLFSSHLVRDRLSPLRRTPCFRLGLLQRLVILCQLVLQTVPALRRGKFHSTVLRPCSTSRWDHSRCPSCDSPRLPSVEHGLRHLRPNS